MNKAIDVAKIIINCLKDGDDYTVSNMALNKLLYFAQAHCLARLGHSLFEDRIEAWVNGPVVPSVYHAYKGFHAMPIVLTESVRDELSVEERDLLSDVVREYGKYSAKYLVNLSHKKGSPWQLNYNDSDAFHNTEIRHEELLRYFSQNEILPKFIIPANIPVVNSAPNDWYNPEEDTVWEAYAV